MDDPEVSLITFLQIQKPGHINYRINHDRYRMLIFFIKSFHFAPYALSWQTENHIINFIFCEMQEIEILSDFAYTSPSVCTQSGIEAVSFAFDAE